MKPACICVALLVCVACTPATPTVEENGALPRSMPEAQGVSSAGILAFLDTIERLNERAPGDPALVTPEFHSVMIVRNGFVVTEGWWAPYAADRNHALFSLSKSFTSTAIGLAIQEGFLGLDDTVVSFFPDKLPARLSANLESMTVRHLLTMSSGQSRDDRTTDDWVQTFLALPVETPPGEQFRYSTSATFMLSAILQETTGETLMAFLTPRLFEPLSIADVEWLESPQGYTTGGYGMSAKTEDIAKLGQLYLQEGMWNGQQILAPEWVEMATSKQIDNAETPGAPEDVTNDWAQGYGFQFWQTTHNAYRGDGAFGQFCLVIPELDLVIAITGGSPDMQAMLDVIWEFLLPAIHDADLPEDEDAYAQLTDRLRVLGTLQPSNATLQLPAQPTYALDANPFGAQTVGYSATDTVLSFSLTDSTSVHTVQCGFDSWMMNDATGPLLPGNILSRALPDTLAVASHCRPVNDTSVEMLWRLIDTPRTLSLIHTFTETGIRIERAWFNDSGGVDAVLASPAVEG